MHETLQLPPGRSGHVWWHEPHGKLHHWHHHDEPELTLVCAGSARYLIKDTAYPLAPGDLLFLFPAQEHLLVDLSDDFACWIGVIRPATLRRAATGPAYAELRAADPAIDLVRRADRGDAALVDGLCREEASAAQPAAANALITALFLAAWHAFARSPASDATTMHPAVERAAALLADDPEAQLEDVARRAGLSQSRLSRLFHQQVGETLVAYRTRQRLERFARLRRAHPGRTLLSLALDAGFGSYAQFHRAVRRFTGVSPHEWDDRPFVPEAQAPPGALSRQPVITSKDSRPTR